MTSGAPPSLRPLAALTLLVTAVHVLLLAGLPLPWRSGETAAPPTPVLRTRTLPPATEATEAPAAPAPATAAAPLAARPPPAVRPAKPAPAATSPAATARDSDARPTLMPDAGDLPVSRSPDATTSVAPDTPTMDTETVAKAAVPASAAATAAVTPAPKTPSGAHLPATVAAPVRLQYAVAAEVKRLPYRAQAELLWRHDGHRYDAQLTLSALFVGTRTQTSAGEITPEGLAPRRFSDKSRTELAAHFDPARGRVTFSANTPEAALLPGAQDRLSLFLQLGALMAANPARFAPGSSVSVQTVGPRDAEVWEFRIAAGETLEVAGQPLETRKLTRAPRAEHDTRVELWLAPQLEYLPARIRITQSSGDFVEQTLTGTEPTGAPR